MLRDALPCAIGRLAALGRWEKIASFLWIGGFLVIAGRVVVSSRDHSLYPIFAGAGQNWLAGADLYESLANPYRYSPLVAVFFAPFSLLPEALGNVLWR